MRVRAFATADDRRTQIRAAAFWKPTWFSEAEQRPRLRGEPLSAETLETGFLLLPAPVGTVSVRIADGFYGEQERIVTIDWPGQVRDLDVDFIEKSSNVRVTVVGIDGATPVAGARVSLSAAGLLPQAGVTDALGQKLWQMVPAGAVSVTATATTGTVDRTGRSDGLLPGGGRTLDLVVRLSPIGDVIGTVTDGGTGQAIDGALVALYEESHPYRRFPAAPDWLRADAQGHFRFAGVTAGGFTVVAKDRNQDTRQARVHDVLVSDLQQLDLGNIAVGSGVGTLSILVRDPVSGGAVPGCQVRLSGGAAGVDDLSTSDEDGRARFEALPIGTYEAGAFHAPSGRGGRLDGLRLAFPGDVVEATLWLDTRGEIDGTVLDGDSPLGGAVVRLTGSVNGRSWGTPLTALVSTATSGNSIGSYSFVGIPEGRFDLEAGIEGSVRRARGEARLTATAPLARLDLRLDAVGEAAVELLEKEAAGSTRPVAASPGAFSVRLRQEAYDFTAITPTVVGGRSLFLFPEVLTGKGLAVDVQELLGQAPARKRLGTGGPGSGSSARGRARSEGERAGPGEPRRSSPSSAPTSRSPRGERASGTSPVRKGRSRCLTSPRDG